MAIAHDYLHAVLNRAREGMEPRTFVPNWLDAPRPFKVYRDVRVAELPVGPVGTAGSLRTAFEPALGNSAEAFTLERLATMLKESYGFLGRRLEINANEDLDKIQSYRSAKFNRGVASGGGRYPVSIYWIAGSGAGVDPGIYYYNTISHGLQQLLHGDVSGRVAKALGARGDGIPNTNQFLVLGLKFWQNSFKYNNFCYHAVTMDIGTLAQSWRMWARAWGSDVRPALWFDEADLGDLLGVQPQEEGIVGVVPLCWQSAPVPRPTGAEPTGARPTETGLTGGEAVSVAHQDSERSREVLRFDFLEAVHRETMTGATERPDGAALDSARSLPTRPGSLVSLPEPDFGDACLGTATRARTSSFGRFVADPLPTGQLSTLLAAASHGAALPCDIPPASAERSLELVKICVFVNHVAGVQAGSYEYDQDANGLRLLKAGPCGKFLQRNYFLSNYNVEQCGAVIVPVVRGDAVIDAVGPRGYRLANALVGAVAQAVYTASAGIGVGCGAALGFDNISYIEELGLSGTGELPLLMIMVGEQRAGRGAYRFEIA